MNNTNTQPVTITSLETNNILRLTAVQLTLDAEGKAIVIGGDNAQGKSSLLDSIVIGLAGGKSIPPDPVHHGAKNGNIKIGLSNGMTVERRVNPDRSGDVKVTDAEGGKYDSPQRLLDGLCGKLTFDPLAFGMAEAKEQVIILEKLCGIDSAAMERQRKTIYDERTIVGRQRDAAKGQYDGLMYYPDAPPEAVDVAALGKELQEAQAHNSAIENGTLITNGVKTQREQAQAEADDLITRLDVLKTKIQGLETQIIEREKKAESMKLIDTSELELKLTTVNETNRQVRSNEDFGKAATEWNQFKEQYDKFTLDLDALAALKTKAIRDTKLPLDGLDFGEDGVLYNGVPFVEQASTAEKIKVSVAMGMALNPDLRVMLLRQGAALDEKSLATVAQMAVAEGYQVWIERVGKGKECSIIIEDGMLQA